MSFRSNHTCNLTEVTDADGVVEGRARYDAFGRLLDNTIPATLTTRLYTGSIYASATLSAGDPATRLYKIGARWYDPGIGLWLTPDSLVPDVNNPIAWNPYAFNYNNPVNYVDPSGHFPWLAVGAIALAGGLGSGFAWLRGYGPDTWQFYAAGAAAAGTAGLGFATSGVLGFALDAGAGALADTLIFGDDPGSALLYNVGANLAFAAIGRGARYLWSSRAVRAMRGMGDESIWPVPRASDIAEPLGGRLSGPEGYAYNVRNKGGGELWVISGEMNQHEFASLVDDYDGPIHILSGAHGDPSGGFSRVLGFFEVDHWRWGGKSGVRITDIYDISGSEFNNIINAPSRVICAWCYSHVSYNVIRALK